MLLAEGWLGSSLATPVVVPLEEVDAVESTDDVEIDGWMPFTWPLTRGPLGRVTLPSTAGGCSPLVGLG